MNARLDPAPLLAESRWLANLARKLVVDGAEAEDLAQETMATALRSRIDTDRPVRAWLAKVLRDRHADRGRAESARRVRERAGARVEVLPATLDVVAKAEIHRELVQAVLALDEPYRTTVLLRFFEDLPPRAIARRMQSNVETVNSRLQRAIAMLRDALDRGRRRTEWLAALVPLALDGGRASSWKIGVPLVSGSLKVAITAASIAGVLAWIWSLNTESMPTDTGTAAGAQRSDSPAYSPQELATPLVHSGRTTTDARESAGPATTDSTRAAEPVLARAPLRIRVLDLEGQGRPNVLLGVAAHGGGDALELGRSGAGGRIAIELESGIDAISSIDPLWSTVLAASTRTAPTNEAVVLVAPRLDFAGHVLEPAGTPLAHVEVSLRLPQNLGAELGMLLDYSTARAWRTHTNSDGAFVLSDVPSVMHGALHAALSGFETSVVAMPSFPDGSMRIVLARPELATGIVHGVVVDPGGAVVEGARVSAGGVVATTDARGEFALDMSADAFLPRLVAVSPGYQPAVLDAEREGESTRWPARVVLRLGPPPLVIAGLVVDSSGKPVEGARVWITDPLVVGTQDGDVLLAENVLAGRTASFWSFETTAADGRFELKGLADRVYRVAAMDERTLSRADDHQVRAGERALEIELDRDVFELVRGRVVARDGTPIAGVSVKFQRPALEVAVPGGTRDEWIDSAGVTTDEKGTFALRDVSRQGVEIFAWGDAILFNGKMVERDMDALAFELEVDRRVHLQIELDPPLDRADELQVLDSTGRPMLLRVMRGEAAFSNRRSPIENGRSQVLSLGEGAREVVLLRSRVEVGRLPVVLAMTGVNRLRW